MRLAQLLAALVLVASQTTAQPATAPSPLIGTWESVDRESNQGSIMVFAGDNSVVAILSVMADGRYTRNGNRIRVTQVDGIRSDFNVVITGNTLTQTRSGKSLKMTRIPGSGPDTGIVGKWRFPYEAPSVSARQATMEYTADGINRLRLALQTQAGTYSVSGNELTLRFPNAPPQTGAFSIDGDLLILQRPDGALVRLARTR